MLVKFEERKDLQAERKHKLLAIEKIVQINTHLGYEWTLKGTQSGEDINDFFTFCLEIATEILEGSFKTNEKGGISYEEIQKVKGIKNALRTLSDVNRIIFCKKQGIDPKRWKKVLRNRPGEISEELEKIKKNANEKENKKRKNI